MCYSYLSLLIPITDEADTTHPHPSELPSRKTFPDTRCLSTQDSISSISGTGKILPVPSGPPVRNSCAKYWANSDAGNTIKHQLEPCSFSKNLRAHCLGFSGKLMSFTFPFSFPLTSQSGKVSLLLPSLLTPGLSTLRRLSSTSVLSIPFPFTLGCPGSPCPKILWRCPILRLGLCADPGI